MPDISQYIDSKIEQIAYNIDAKSYKEALNNVMSLLDTLEGFDSYAGVKEWLQQNAATSIKNLVLFHEAYNSQYENLPIDTLEERKT